jgi:tetratricopeptide (TPR) repeat protein
MATQIIQMSPPPQPCRKTNLWHLFFGVLFKHAVTVCAVVLLGSIPAAAHEAISEQVLAINAEIRKDPTNADLYLKRGELQRLERNYNAALQDYSRAEKLDPKLKILEFCRGRLFFESGKPQTARKHLDRYLDFDPNHIQALVTRARVLAQLKDPEAAIRDYDRAISAGSEPKPEYYIERAEAAASLGQTERAVKGLDQGIEKLGPLVTLQLPAIDLDLSRKEYDSALKRLETLAAQSERKESWLARRGDILKSAGRHSEAIVAYNQAVHSIQTLPPHLRETRAVKDLEARIYQELKTQQKQ